MKMFAIRWLASMCALPLLASCGLSRQTQPTITRTELVSVPVPAYKPLPVSLTAPLAEPPAPPLLCVDEAGHPAVCVFDALATIPEWRHTLDMCNGDRARAAMLGATHGQP